MVSVMQLLFSAVRTFVQVAFLASFVFWHRVGPALRFVFFRGIIFCLFANTL